MLFSKYVLIVKMATIDVLKIKKLIYGDILVSEAISDSLRKWRNIFNISQVELARWMGIASSVISEYENERKISPGTRFLKKFVDSLIEIDLKKGGKTLYLLLNSIEEYFEDKHAILMVKDYFEPFNADKLIEYVDGEILAGGEHLKNTYLYGFTVIDSLEAILSLSGESFYKIFGRSTERALIFTNVSTGRSPMVAIRVYPFKPRMVIIHKPEKVDSLSIKIAMKEHVIYVLSRLNTSEFLLKKLEEFHERLLEK